MRVRIPPVASVGTAIKLFYSFPLFSSTNIKELFGCSDSTAWKLKQKAFEHQKKNGVPVYNALLVDTQSAFESWGLDISTLETMYKKQIEYGLEVN